MVHGGERKRRSRISRREGMAWKPRSVEGGTGKYVTIVVSVVKATFKLVIQERHFRRRGWREREREIGEQGHTGKKRQLHILRHLRSIAHKPQYKVLIRHSSGAEHMDRMFLTRKIRGDSVMSARDPAAKVRVASDRPMMVKYWKCQP